MYHWTAFVTLLAVAFYLYTGVNVSRSRVATGVKVPATSGHPEFERAFRIQMNTLEWMPIFLPALWLFAIYLSDPIAAAIGVVWIAGRVLYLIGYSKEASKRGRGFAIQAFASIALWLGATGAVLWRLIG
jgi:glutathione S-transferase